MNFGNWANPTLAEIETWAFEPNSYAPEQDFNLILAEDQYIDLVLNLSSNKKCPKQLFFLQCLYIYVGQKVRNNPNPPKRMDILEKAKLINSELISKWLDRSEKLLKNPSSFNYDDWCNARLAQK